MSANKTVLSIEETPDGHTVIITMDKDFFSTALEVVRQQLASSLKIMSESTISNPVAKASTPAPAPRKRGMKDTVTTVT